MKQDGQENRDVKIYHDAGHAFENPNNKEGYRAEDAADAWRRTTDFLAATSEEIEPLRGGVPSPKQAPLASRPLLIRRLNNHLRRQKSARELSRFV